MNTYELFNKLREALERSYGNKGKVELVVSCDPKRCDPAVGDLLRRGVTVRFEATEKPAQIAWLAASVQTAEVQL